MKYRRILREDRERSKDSSREEIALDLRKPEFQLIEARRVRRREVQMHAGMLGQKRGDASGLMCRKVVDDDVDLAPTGLGHHDVAQELDKRFTGVARDRLRDDPPVRLLRAA